MDEIKKKEVLNGKLAKALSGVKGLDEITDGGLPKNRPTIICGNAGCGKTVMSMEFLVNGCVKYDEPGVFMSFEETREELIANMLSFGSDLESLTKQGKIYIEYLEVDKTQIIETGKYDLEGLFVRLQSAITKVGAKRVVLDSIDSLFHGLTYKILRPEIIRLFKWLKEKSVTAIITSEVENAFHENSRLEQYIADCVIALDNRIIDQIATRRLRITKMRGSMHGNNEYPFIIDACGISVLPLISPLKDQRLTNNRISTGIKDLDDMLSGKGFFEGSSALISGSAGTGKTSLAMSLINAAGKRKTRSLYCAFEESSVQITRNMGAIGIDIEPYLESEMLKFYCSRPTLQNLELHLISIQQIIEEFKPEIVVLDPVTNLMSEGINSEVRLMLAQFTDYLKGKNITTVYTAAITLETIKSNASDEGISAMVDTWILVRDIEKQSERNRGIYVLKSRGMSHSTQVREFVITDQGINILPAYITPAGILTGSEKLEHSLNQDTKGILRESKKKNELVEIERKRKIMQEKIATLMSNLESEIDAFKLIEAQEALQLELEQLNRAKINDLRNKTKNTAKNKE